MVCWLVGGKCVVPDHPRSTLDSPRHFQTSKGTNANNFPVNQNHPRHLWPNFKKSNILTFLDIGQVTLTPRGSIGNINPGLWDLKCEILYGLPTSTPNMRSQTWEMAEPTCRHRRDPIIISGQGKMVCWLVGGKCVKGSCPRSTLINNRQSQSPPNINLGQ